MDQETEKNLLAIVKRNYEEIAVDFANTRKNCSWPELAKLTGLVKDGDRVLDAGCGNGRLLGSFGGKEIRYLGVDSNRRLIEAAKGHPRLRTGNKEFVLGDVLELDKIPEKDFDYVFSVAVLHHLPGQASRVRALELMKNKLRPGGKIIITVWNLWQQEKFRKLIIKFTKLKILGQNKMDFGDILFDWKNNQAEGVSQRYYHAFTKRELKKNAALAGLKINELYKDENNYYLVLEN